MTTPSNTISPINTAIKAPQPIWNGGTGFAPLIINNDPVNMLYIGAKADVLRQDQSSCIPIWPLGSQVWADVDVWAFAPVTVNTCLIIPGGTVYSPSPAQVAISEAGLATLAAQNTQIGQLSSSPTKTIANDIAVQGAPLLHGNDDIFTNMSYTVPPGLQEANTVSTQFFKPGYAIRVEATYAVAPTVPFVGAELYWYEVTNTYTVAHERWVFCAEHAANTYRTLGKGPTKGEWVQIYWSNYDPAQTATVKLWMTENTQHIARDDWRTIPEAGSAVPVYTLLPNNAMMAEGYLANDAVTVNANTTDTWLLPLYAGQVWVTVAPETATSGQNWNIVDALTGQVVFAGSAEAATPSDAIPVVLGRHPYTFSIDNTNGVDAFITKVIITLEEYAS